MALFHNVRKGVTRMAKRKWRKGPKISSLDKPTPKEWFMSWQFRMTAQALKGGIIRYAMPESQSTRFSDEEIIRAERRLRTPPTLEGRKELIKLLNAHDCGTADIDEIIDRYEDVLAYLGGA